MLAYVYIIRDWQAFSFRGKQNTLLLKTVLSWLLLHQFCWVYFLVLFQLTSSSPCWALVCRNRLFPFHLGSVLTLSLRKSFLNTLRERCDNMVLLMDMILYTCTRDFTPKMVCLVLQEQFWGVIYLCVWINYWVSVGKSVFNTKCWSYVCSCANMTYPLLPCFLCLVTFPDYVSTELCRILLYSAIFHKEV